MNILSLFATSIGVGLLGWGLDDVWTPRTVGICYISSAVGCAFAAAMWVN
jgi:hypothetical protein